MTYAFGRLHGLGSLPWHPSETTDKMLGNPSVSNVVSSYMVSLRRRKVQDGETATSARAITPVMLLLVDLDIDEPKHIPSSHMFLENGARRPYTNGVVRAHTAFSLPSCHPLS